MNTEDFEDRLRRQPMREIPREWRVEILSAAHSAAGRHHAPPTTFHVSRFTFHALLWPSPRAWAGLAAIWVVILAVNFSVGGDSQVMAEHLTPPSPRFFLALQEQQRVLAEPTAPPHEMLDVEPPKSIPPRPRSDRRRENADGLG